MTKPRRTAPLGKQPTLDHGRIAPAYALAHIAPEFFEDLDETERMILPYIDDLWARPDQYLPPGNWRYCGFICGRGWGKTYTIAQAVNRLVESGQVRSPALMAPNDDRVRDVQVKNLVEASPPWFRAEAYRGGVRWPNGVIAVPFTPYEPGRSRSENIDLSWLCEIVDWQATTRQDAFENITTATRVGIARILWDTTSKGRNEIIKYLMDAHAEDPAQYPIVRGTTFDNPMLSRNVLRDTVRKYSGRRYEEEVEGKVFAEAAGALWEDSWIDRHRVLSAPIAPDLRLVGIDPALSTRDDADETGICVASRVYVGDTAHAYIEKNLTGRHRPEQWGDIAIEECIQGQCAGIVLERNHAGDPAVYVLRSRAQAHGLQVREVPNDGSPFPHRTPGVIYVRQVHPNTSKTTRAEGPAAETQLGHVHIVGHQPKLEAQMTTYEPCTGQKSPNDYDAMVHTVIELLGISESRHKTTPRDMAAANAAAASLRKKLAAHSGARARGLGL